MVTISIIEKCAQADEHAQRVVFDLYGDRLISLAFRYLDNVMDAEDAVANAFIKIFSSIKKCTFEEVYLFEAWMQRITINESLNILRKRYKFPTTELIERDFGPEFDQNIFSDFTVNEILDIIRKLPLGYRTVLNLFALEGFSHEEISDMLGISVGASKSQLSKARALLKKKLNQLEKHEF